MGKKQKNKLSKTNKMKVRTYKKQREINILCLTLIFFFAKILNVL